MSSFKCMLAFLLCLRVLSGCTGSKSLAKQGDRYDVSGMYNEAAELYLQSALRSTRNIEARIGLKKNGQRVLDDKLSSFFQAYAQEDRPVAVDAYLAAQAYMARVARTGVQLEMPAHYTQDFEAIKGRYLAGLYTDGEALLEQEDFAAAQAAFDRIHALDPGYRSTADLRRASVLEPLYRQAKAALGQGAYRKAFETFGQVLAQDAAYRDARTLQQQAREKGLYVVAVVPFSGPANAKEEVSALQAYALTALTRVNDPFLSVVDRENMQRILDEQRWGLSGVLDERTAAEAGKLLGAKAVVVGALVSYREEPGRMRTTEQQAMEAYTVKEFNKTTQKEEEQVRYRPVKFLRYTQRNRTVASISYRLVSLETGQVLFSNVVEREMADEVDHASYKGNVAALYPVLNGVLDTRVAARRELQSLFTANTQLRSVEELGVDILRNACEQLAREVGAQVRTTVQ